MTRQLVWVAVVALLVLRYDWWFWSDSTIVAGFLPVGLFYQVLISLGAGLAWALVVKYAWPTRLEEWASAAEPKTTAPLNAAEVTEKNGG